jgi:hypothetical protein
MGVFPLLLLLLLLLLLFVSFLFLFDGSIKETHHPKLNKNLERHPQQINTTNNHVENYIQPNFKFHEIIKPEQTLGQCLVNYIQPNFKFHEIMKPEQTLGQCLVK